MQLCCNRQSGIQTEIQTDRIHLPYRHMQYLNHEWASNSHCVTDRQTDRQTDIRHTDTISQRRTLKFPWRRPNNCSCVATGSLAYRQKYRQTAYICHTDTCNILTMNEHQIVTASQTVRQTDRQTDRHPPYRHNISTLNAAVSVAYAL